MSRDTVYEPHGLHDAHLSPIIFGLYMKSHNCWTEVDGVMADQVGTTGQCLLTSATRL